MKHFVILLLGVFLPGLAMAALHKGMDCTKNKTCIEHHQGRMKLTTPNEIGYIKEYYLYKDHIVGISVNKGYFIYDKEKKEVQHFNNSENWVKELKGRNLGPLPTNNYNQTANMVNQRSILQDLNFDRATNCFVVDQYIVGEGERYNYFIFNEKTQQTEHFMTPRRWLSAIDLKGLTPLITRWHKSSWNFPVVEDAINWSLSNMKITLGALGGLILLHLVLIFKVLGSRSQSFKMGVLCFTTLEMVGLAYLIMANLPYSF